MFIDLHVHSKQSFDNLNGPTKYQIYQKLNSLGINGVAITDHDVLSTTQSSIDTGFDLLTIPGVEYTAREGHLLILGTCKEIYPNLPLDRVFDQINRSNCVVIAAHPYDPLYGIGDAILDFSEYFDAIEINGKRSSQINKIAKAVAEEVALPTIGGSDAHKLNQLGTVVTEFDVSVQSWRDCIKAIKNKSCSAKFL